MFRTRGARVLRGGGWAKGRAGHAVLGVALLPEASQVAADRLYWSTTARLADGLARAMASRRETANPDPRRGEVVALWGASAAER